MDYLRHVAIVTENLLADSPWLESIHITSFSSHIVFSKLLLPHFFLNQHFSVSSQNIATSLEQVMVSPTAMMWFIRFLGQYTGNVQLSPLTLETIQWHQTVRERETQPKLYRSYIKITYITVTPAHLCFYHRNKRTDKKNSEVQPENNLK